MILIYHNHLSMSLQAADYTEITDSPDNPYMGWYHINGYTISDESQFDGKTIQVRAQEDSCRLTQIQMNLKAYSDGPISEAGLAEIDTIMDAWAATDHQMIVRFLYDWDGKARETEPDDISIIQHHMTQVATILNEHKDSVYILQGIFVGDCGEMHGTDYMERTAMLTLMDTYANATDDSIFLGVRTPSQWRVFCQSYDATAVEEAYSGSLISRVSLFNDGMLGSGNDLGTYGDTSLADADDYGDKGTRREEIDFQNQLCTFVPNGGEVVLPNIQNDFENAIVDLSAMRVSYLNCDYDANVFEKWKSSTYHGNDIYNGMNGFDYISLHLGYRYVIRDCSISSQDKFLPSYHLAIAIDNVGFAPCYMPLSMEIVCMNQSSEKTTRIPIDGDSRLLLANNHNTLSVSLPKNLTKGTYDISLQLTDPTTEETIAFANMENGHLGTLTIQ